MTRPKFEVPHRKPIVGLVGGIGSGKSQVASVLSGHGGHLIVADRIGHEGLEHPPIREAIFKRWGDRARGDNGEVDRKKLGAIVFASPVERTNLEYLVFPYIEAGVRAEVARAEEDPNCRFIVLDAPIMLEVGWNTLCDRIVYVDAPRSTRLARLGPARGWNEDELARRELAQMSLAEKQRLSHATLDNGGTLEEMHARIGQLIRDWKLDNP
jgi:dephospho-CoA kinase